MKKRLATHVSLIVLMFVLSRAEEAQAQRIKERLEKKSVVGGGKKAALAVKTKIARRAPGQMRERARAYEPLIAAAARRHAVDPRALWTIAYLETRFRPAAVSPHGARGLMQFMPATARAYGLRDPHHPAAAIDAAARHVKILAARYNHRLDLVLASYHAGESVVDAYMSGAIVNLPSGKTINRRKMKTGGVPPYKGTQKYVARGLAVYSRVANAEIFDAQLIAQVASLSLPVEEAAPIISPSGFALSAQEGAPEKTVSHADQLTPAPVAAPQQRPIVTPIVALRANERAFSAALSKPVSFDSSVAAQTRPRRVVATWQHDLSLADEDLFFDLHSGEHFIINAPAQTENPSSALEAPQQQIIRERLNADWNISGGQRRRSVNASSFDNK